MKTVFIYSLSTLENPNKIRYIGKTVSKLNRRLYQHTANTHLKENNTHKTNWLNFEINHNNTPIINLIDEVTGEDWQFWEMYWIEQFKVWGFDLTNSTKGGEIDWTGKKHKKESIKKMKLARKNNIEVIQYDLSGNIIGEFISMEEAARKTKSNRSHISYCCKRIKNYNTVKNTVFRIKGDYFDYKPRDKSVNKLNIKVYQYGKSGKLLNVFDSLSKAEKETKINSQSISYCIKGKLNYNTAGGFVWKNAKQTFSITKRKESKHLCKRIVQLEKNNKIVKTYESINDAANKIGIYSSGISSCCRGKQKTAGGFKWRFS